MKLKEVLVPMYVTEEGVEVSTAQRGEKRYLLGNHMVKRLLKDGEKLILEVANPIGGNLMESQIEIAPEDLSREVIEFNQENLQGVVIEC